MRGAVAPKELGELRRRRRAMAERRPLYTTCVAVLGFVCLVVGATAVGLPVWGYFDTPNGESAGTRRAGPG